jgi:hypothetical protein
MLCPNGQVYTHTNPKPTNDKQPHKCNLIRATLHLEAGPFRCVRGLKSSLVIGQKAQIGPNPFTPRGRANLVVFFKSKNCML